MFSIIDVGGQRSERKKWMHCFDQVMGIIFVAGLSDYDLMLAEEQSTNRMSESLLLFASICNNRLFYSSSMILFLNKTDLFEAKIVDPAGMPLTSCFPLYRGGRHSAPEAMDFVKRQFLAQYIGGDKLIYTHFTCATKTDNIRFVFVAVSDMLICQMLSFCGLY